MVWDIVKTLKPGGAGGPKSRGGRSEFRKGLPGKYW